MHKQTQIYKLRLNIRERLHNLHLPPCKDHCYNLVTWNIIAKASSITIPTRTKTTQSQANYIIISKLHCVKKIFVNMGIMQLHCTELYELTTFSIILSVQWPLKVVVLLVLSYISETLQAIFSFVIFRYYKRRHWL